MSQEQISNHNKLKSLHEELEAALDHFNQGLSITEYLKSLGYGHDYAETSSDTLLRASFYLKQAVYAGEKVLEE